MIITPVIVALQLMKLTLSILKKLTKVYMAVTQFKGSSNTLRFSDSEFNFNF